MDEQRTQAYINLINQLLTCNEGDEPRILQENQELVDQGLIEVMIAVAQQYKEAGRENEAQWLMNIVQQLAQALGLLDNELIETTNTPQDYLNFLMKLLQKVDENPNPQVIYPFLQQHLDKLDDTLIEILKIWARERLASATKEDSVSIAVIIGNFSNLVQDFPHGNIAINIEIAITGYYIILTIFTFEVLPEAWADTQNNLADAYRKRIRGNKADNLEMALVICKKSLKVFTYNNFSEQWANTQNHLGTIYVNRIKEERGENLELAIASYNKSLKVYTYENFPYEWARSKNNLATVYMTRIKGEKAENLELALLSLQEALKVYTYENFPYDWAVAQNNLGLVYEQRIRGQKADNLELAITTYQESLKVFKLDIFPERWANTQNNLSLAYQIRIKEKKEKNLKLAIWALQESLKVYTYENFPYEWARSENNLGNAYMECYHNGIDNNLKLAIIAHEESLKVYNRNSFPYEWAGVQNNLGWAYSQIIEEDKPKNLEIAISAYQKALQIRTMEAFPQECLDTARNLANLHYNEKKWQPAIETYHTAIEALENTRLEALNPQSRQEVLSNAIDVFHRIVQAYLNLNQPEKALEYIERSKGRNLVELMTQKGLNPQNVSQETIEKLAELKQKVVNEQIRLQHQSINQNLMLSDNLMPYVQDHSYLKEYQQELDTFIAEKITPYDPTFSLTQKVQSIPFEDIKSLTDDSNCLLQWYITGENILAFIVSADEMVKVWQSSKDDRNQLIDTLNKYLQLYYSKEGKKEWMTQLPDLLQTFVDTLHINDIVSLIPETCQRLIIIPHWFLHILPIHALPINNNYILQDKYDIQYAPSCQLLKITKQRPLNQLTNFFALQNPTKDLIFTDLEVNIISTLFNQKEIIAKDKATKNTVTTHLKASESHCYHFSCHGSFNPNNPLESALLLANKDELTLGEIFELDLKKSRLVVLSACETGLIDLNSISDEYIGLPAGFLFAGSSSVVSSLWTVSDLSTSLLMMKFYEIILDKTQNISIPVALKMAQNWLRNLTSQGGIQYLETRIKPNLNQLYPNKPKSADQDYH